MNIINSTTNGERVASLLRKSKWISLLGVISLYLSSVVLVIIGVLKIYYILKDLILQLIIYGKIDTIILSANFILIIEIYLLSIIFYILAIGIYQLFVGDYKILNWYNLESLDEMKSELSKAIVIFLCVFLLQKIIEWKNPIQLLYSGIVISFICSILIWFSISLQKKNNNNVINHSNHLQKEKEIV